MGNVVTASTTNSKQRGQGVTARLTNDLHLERLDDEVLECVKLLTCLIRRRSLLAAFQRSVA